MARKASDLFSLLSSRGRSRSRRGSGWLGSVGGFFGSLVRRRTEPVPPRPGMVPGYAAVAVALLALVVGYVVGGVFPLKAFAGDADLSVGQKGEGTERKAVEPQKPGPMQPPGERRAPTAQEVAPLTQSALCVTLYDDDQDGSIALATAWYLNEYLKAHGPARARPRRLWLKNGASTWGTVVYYDGEGEFDSLVQRLREIPSPDPVYESYKIGTTWPFKV